MTSPFYDKINMQAEYIKEIKTLVMLSEPKNEMNSAEKERKAMMKMWNEMNDPKPSWEEFKRKVAHDRKLWHEVMEKSWEIE